MFKTVVLFVCLFLTKLQYWGKQLDWKCGEGLFLIIILLQWGGNFYRLTI